MVWACYSYLQDTELVTLGPRVEYLITGLRLVKPYTLTNGTKINRSRNQ